MVAPVESPNSPLNWYSSLCVYHLAVNQCLDEPTLLNYGEHETSQHETSQQILAAVSRFTCCLWPSELVPLISLFNRSTHLPDSPPRAVPLSTP